MKLNKIRLCLLGAALLALSAFAPPCRAEAYLLAPDDQIDITVQGHDDLKESATVLPDGTITYPILHTVHAAGQSLADLTQILADGLTRSGQVNGPQVTVSLRESRPRKVSIAGAVKQPGLYDYRDGLRVRDLILQAGGPVPDAAQAKATLLAADGGSQTLSLSALLGGTDPAANLPLRPGDLLSVQAAPPEQVQIVGEVVKPGAYESPPDGLSARSLLLLAGGGTPRAALSRAQILHGGQVRTVNLHVLLESLDAPENRLRLCPGDVLLVPVSAARVAVLGEVRLPAAYDIPDGGTLSVTDAVILAGSVTGEADGKNAVLLRRTEAGSPVQIAVNLSDLLRGKSASDPAMQPGDILYVPGRRAHGLGAAQIVQFLPVVGLFAGRL